MNDEVWPLVYFCARCKMRYTMSKANRPPEKWEWAKSYGYAGDPNDWKKGYWSD